MRHLDLLSEVAALAGYNIGSSGQDLTNKNRAIRRLTTVKADVVGRFNDWPAMYREGWLQLVPLYEDGTVDVTNASRTVSGTATAWTSAMKGRKFIAPNGEHYRIASITNSGSLILEQPYQGETATAQNYKIWKDEYALYPAVRTIGGFVDYSSEAVMREATANQMKGSYPNPSYAEATAVYTVVGREPLSAAYSTGTVSGSANTTILTGAGTSWLDNIEPGYEIKIGTTYYTVRRVNSDTEIELCQLIVATIAPLTTYSAIGKNAPIVRFNHPSAAKVASYWYYAKDVPLVNDSDEDWVCEMFPKVILNGIAYFDYMDKNDPVRADRARVTYEESIRDMHVSALNAYMGVRTVGLYIPQDAWE